MILLGARRDIIVFTGIAVLYLAAAWLINRAVGLFTPDPDYAYLLSGLDILTFKAPTFVDHPGTPIQTIIAIVLGATWLVTLPWHGLSNIQDAVLAQPQFYMQCVNGVFAAGIAGAMIYFAWCVRKTSGLVTPALVGLVSIFTSNAVYMTFHRIMPEPALLGATLVLAALVARATFAEDGFLDSRKFALASGILLGLCLTAKVTSAPLLLVLFFPRAWGARKTAFKAFAISAVIFLLPISARWHAMIRNYIHILTHRGNYGSGTAGAPTLSELIGNILALQSALPELFLSLGLFAIVLLGQYFLKRSLPRNLSRALLLCVATISAGLLMVAKQPHPYYTIPEFAFMCLGNTIVAFLALRYARLPLWVAGAVIILIANKAVRGDYRYAQSDASSAKSNAALVETAAKRGCLTVFYYGVNHPQFDLFFGNVFSGRWFSGRLQHLYPDFIAYNTGTKEYATFDDNVTQPALQARLARAKCIDFLGVQWDSSFGIPAASLVPVANQNGVYLYSFARP